MSSSKASSHRAPIPRHHAVGYGAPLPLIAPLQPHRAPRSVAEGGGTLPVPPHSSSLPSASVPPSPAVLLPSPDYLARLELENSRLREETRTWRTKSEAASSALAQANLQNVLHRRAVEERDVRLQQSGLVLEQQRDRVDELSGRLTRGAEELDDLQGRLADMSSALVQLGDERAAAHAQLREVKDTLRGVTFDRNLLRIGLTARERELYWVQQALAGLEERNTSLCAAAEGSSGEVDAQYLALQTRYLQLLEEFCNSRVPRSLYRHMRSDRDYFRSAWIEVTTSPAAVPPPPYSDPHSPSRSISDMAVEDLGSPVASGSRFRSERLFEEVEEGEIAEDGDLMSPD
ncbi:uncharacterized protein SCHCODRAFT_02670971 [Schizophyllum commune H4-8]|uniref:Uncharacterized protein n=1 Tax=Schizophyllum commune (strain H4-8 / FGSC 9210) TaxID=578458 RepID=D8QEC5_SCHCM|nr:uncharacterized protein SCHCODRAFT_02670971 [Schizophyllum commune H4-8]KAI5888353.1 hypothetical protein SCHCODRAFT_02670971 [Schizophyllum commune H4-8]